MSIIIEHGGETELEEEFCKIEQLLFSSIVLYQLKADVVESDFLDDHMNIAPRVLERFLIVPRAQAMPVMINREMTSGYWDHPITELQKNEALIGFVHYYDFCGMDSPRRYEYVRGRILASSKYTEIVGKDLLVPTDLVWIEDKKETEQLAAPDAASPRRRA